MAMMIDPLESRLLLSSSLSHGVLKITGTSRNDQISVNYFKILGMNEVVVQQITLGSTTPHFKKYNPGAIKKIHIVGGAGNDVVTFLASGAAFKFPVFFDGGTGNDTLSAPSAQGKITAKGGTGDDVISTGSAPDSIDGGSGNDTLTGNGGHDTLIGGTGADLLQAEAGNDYFVARDRFRDTLIGGDGADRARVDFLAGTRTANEASIGGIERLL